ncbi:SDR family NAD(P)-dependent oxidoreductase [Massilia sp. S19_KUP03_FR1]|uniref:SDR family NAD(P)-dependent oxidoreductase n=1 Tax=Massilia sp. S19_KUP03_FR1 TaxID=3025503 RepID=UPI002FCD5D04
MLTADFAIPVFAEIQEKGDHGELIALDLDNPASITAAVKGIEARHGSLDVLVNNAAIMLDGGWVSNTTITIDAATLKRTFETNFFGTVALTQALWPLLVKSGHANVVNVSSRMGSNTYHADPSGPLVGVKPFAYDASKAALNALTTHLAELGQPLGIQVNSAYPGWVRTELGTEYAELSVEEGVNTIVDLAMLPPNSRSGKFEHAGSEVPW